MENKIENVKVVAESNTKAVKEIAKIFVVREKFVGSNGTEYWNYCVKDNLRGREIKCGFEPKDNGGYTVLDILYDVTDKAELIVCEEETLMKDGSKMRFTTYKVQAIDSDGVVWECDVKPSRNSDKALLMMLMNVKGIRILRK